jgi:glycosyltransferase involved in cell wall biosynthesis
MPKLSIVIPCYFNEKNIPQTMEALSLVERELLGQVEIEYVFVDDGSKDMTYKELLKIYEKKPHQTKIVKLARNFGAYNAVLAGLGHANGDVLVTLSADLQDPPELIPKMLEYWKKGIKLVIANREAREESFLQSSISNTFHYLMRKFALQNTPDGGFDLVLFDRQIRDDVVRMN